MRWVACVLVLVVGVAGCASSSHGSSRSTTSRPANLRSSTNVHSSTTSALRAVSPSGCTHTPIADVVNSYYGLPAPHGPSIDYRSLQDAPVAHDGRGDTIEQVGLGVEMTGPRGTITLTRTEPGNAVIPRGWGDFNGDGRTDLLVDVDDGKPEYATFIVPGTVGTGTHDPFVVGIRVPHPYIKPGAFEAFPAVVGDQNGDGADDISFGPKLYSGRQLMALPAGAALPAPFRTLPTAYVGLLQLDPHQPPTFVVPDPSRFIRRRGRRPRRRNP